MGLKPPLMAQEVVCVDELAEQALPFDFGQGAPGLVALA